MTSPSTSQPEHVRNLDLYLPDYVERETGLIVNKIFEDCRITGPAVVQSVQGVVLSECNIGFNTTIDSVLWEINPARKITVGAIGLVNCEFHRCRIDAHYRSGCCRICARAGPGRAGAVGVAVERL